MNWSTEINPRETKASRIGVILIRCRPDLKQGCRLALGVLGFRSVGYRKFIRGIYFLELRGAWGVLHADCIAEFEHLGF